MNRIYYLHRETKDLIGKRSDYEFTGDLVEKTWWLDTEDRSTAWRMVLEAAHLGANIERLKELSERWKLTVEDSLVFLAQTEPTKEMKQGLAIWVEQVMEMDQAAYWMQMAAYAAKYDDKKAVKYNDKKVVNR